MHLKHTSSQKARCRKWTKQRVATSDAWFGSKTKPRVLKSNGQRRNLGMVAEHERSSAKQSLLDPLPSKFTGVTVPFDPSDPLPDRIHYQASSATGQVKRIGSTTRQVPLSKTNRIHFLRSTTMQDPLPGKFHYQAGSTTRQVPLPGKILFKMRMWQEPEH